MPRSSSTPAFQGPRSPGTFPSRQETRCPCPATFVVMVMRVLLRRVPQAENVGNVQYVSWRLLAMERGRSMVMAFLELSFRGFLNQLRPPTFILQITYGFLVFCGA